jgi:hypothetical protein
VPFSGSRQQEFKPVGKKEGEGILAMSEDSLLERVTAVAEERHLSQNTLTAYRRTWLKLIAWSAAEGLVLETLPSERADVLWVSTGFFVRVIDMTVAR